MNRFYLIWLIGLFGLAACQPTTAVSTTAQPENEPADVANNPTTVPPTSATAVSTEPPPELPTALPVEEATTPPMAPIEPTLEQVGVENGRTADGAYYLGSSSAPIRMIDYSDFL